MIRLLLVFSLLMAGAPAHAAKPLSAAEVARRLDVTSFPNSIGPRRRPGARTLRDYEYTRVEIQSRDEVSLYRVRPDWLFSIRILSRSGRKTILCIQDKTLSLGTYDVAKPLEVQEGSDGLLRATGRRVKAAACPEWYH
jgi:hypothetical protein